MNSAASRQLPMPPIPEIGTRTSGSCATEATMLSAIGLTAGPQYPPCEERPATFGRGAKVSRSTPVIELIVLINETASAPPFWAARAAQVTSVMLGVSFTITGVFAACFTHSVILQV